MSWVHDSSRAVPVAKNTAEPVDPARPDHAGDTPAVSTASLLTAIEAALDDAIIAASRQGLITVWSGAAERRFGYSSREAVGRSLRIIVPRDRDEEHDGAFARALRGSRRSPSPRTPALTIAIARCSRASTGT